MAYVKQKTFQFEDQLALDFEVFCKQRMLVEKRVAAAAILWFMEKDADLRENILLRYEAYLQRERPLSVAPVTMTGRVPMKIAAKLVPAKHGKSFDKKS